MNGTQIGLLVGGGIVVLAAIIIGIVVGVGDGGVKYGDKVQFSISGSSGKAYLALKDGTLTTSKSKGMGFILQPMDGSKYKVGDPVVTGNDGGVYLKDVATSQFVKLAFASSSSPVYSQCTYGSDPSSGTQFFFKGASMKDGQPVTPLEYGQSTAISPQGGSQVCGEGFGLQIQSDGSIGVTVDTTKSAQYMWTVSHA